MMFLLSKSDRIDPESVETILAWAADPSALESDVISESPTMAREFATQISRLLETMEVSRTLVAVSGVDGTGLDALYSLLQGAVGQGEDATPEFDTFLAGDQEGPSDEPGASDLR